VAAGRFGKSLLVGLTVAVGAIAVANAQSTPPVLRSDPVVRFNSEIAVNPRARATVGITYEISTSGLVNYCRVTETSGDARLDAQACASAARWLYVPATVNGLPVAALASTTVVFGIVEVPPNAGAIRKEDYAGPIASWTSLAEQGNVVAQRSLGVVYGAIRGEGAQAVKWLQVAAAQNDIISQRRLGAMYSEGDGVRRDYVEATKWYGLAAALNDGDAQLKLGELYAEGRLGRRDYAEAMRWYRLAAKQNVPEAMFNIAELYADGRGVSKNLLHAYMWYSASSSFLSRNPGADTRRRIAFTRKVERAMSHEDIVRAMAMSAHCMESKFEDCDDSATMASTVNAESLAKAAQDLASIEEAAALGKALGEAQSPNRRDAAKAVPVLRPFAERGYPLPQTILAGLYERGHGVEQNLPEAARLYRAAAGKGNAEAQVALAAMYERGQGVPENPLKALMWFTLAREAENPHGAIARLNSNRLRRVMADLQASQVDEMVMRCGQSKYQDCD
jgi:TonB family protein